MAAAGFASPTASPPGNSNGGGGISEGISNEGAHPAGSDGLRIPLGPTSCTHGKAPWQTSRMTLAHSGRRGWRPTVSAPNDSWLPSPDEPLFILAMDQRASFAEEVFGVTGPPSEADLVRMRQAKTLVYEGLRHFAGGVRSGREGVLVDEELGTGVLHSAKSDGLVVLLPIEKSGLKEFELEYGDRFASDFR